MNQNSKILITGFIAVIIGLSAGYFLFGRQDAVNEQGAHEHLTAEAGEETIWTCSMHPQVRMEEPGLCPICEMKLIPLSEASSSDPLILEMTEEAVMLADVETTLVGKTGKAGKIILLNGKVQADERRSSSLVAHVPGRIEQLYVSFTGEQVRKGQQLAVIYSPELITAQRELLEALKIQDVSPALLDAARKKLYYWKIPEETIAAIEKSGDIREQFTIYAETGGVVTNRRVSVGDYVKEGSVLFNIIDLGRLWVLFDAYEEDLAAIRTGDEVEFTTPILPEKRFNTHITYIDPVIDPKTRTASVRAEISNQGGLLKPEMLVRGTIFSNTGFGQALVAPRTAVLWTGPRSVVYVKIPGRTIPSYAYREVVLGEAVGNGYLVKNGLEAGEEVVTNGAFAIDAAAQLNNQSSMMNRLVSLKGAETPIAPDYTQTTPASFKKQLQQLTDRYISIKDALVATDPAAASEAARSFMQQLDKVDMFLLKGDAHNSWMKQLKGLKAHAGNISQMAEAEEQRGQFEFLSEIMIETIRAFGLENKKLYVQHCPMAFNDRGADWLSYEEAVRNPYFGEKMLKCGTVKDTVE